MVTVVENSCTFCSFSSAAKKDILRHIKDCHALEPCFCIKCLICARKFRVYSSFTSHVSRSQPGVKVENAYLCDDDSDNEPPSDPQMQTNSMELDDLKLNDNVDISHCSGTFLTGLKEKHLVSC